MIQLLLQSNECIERQNCSQLNETAKLWIIRLAVVACSGVVHIQAKPSSMYTCQSILSLKSNARLLLFEKPIKSAFEWMALLQTGWHDKDFQKMA
jgi:hypothetical protein